MELEINNFKNISQKNIKLDYQLYLFKGVSGSGKSTILEAIKFVLYGASRNAKSLSKKGKTSVKLKYQDIEITRSKNPEFLILKRDGKDFQNSEAQNIINQKFYTEKIWYLGSYIPQNKRNIFLDSNSQEKLEILKELIFKENKDSNLKFFHLLDDLSKCFLDKIKTLDGKIEYLEKDLERLKNENSEYLEIYPQAKEIKNLDEEIIRLGENLKIHFKLEELKKQNIDLKEVKKELENNYPPNLNLETINLWKEYIQNGEDLKDFQVKEYDIEALEKELYIVKNNQMIEEKFSTKDIPSLIENTKKEIEMIACKKKIEKINKLRVYLSSLENQSLNLDNLWRNLLETINHKYRNYNKYLGEIIITTYLSKKRKSYSCPCCNNNLYLENETLKTTNINLTDKEKEEFKGVIKNLEIYNSYKSEAQKKIEILEKEIPKDFQNKKFRDLDVLENNLKILYTYQKTTRGVEIIQSEIKNFHLTQKYKKYKKIINIGFHPPSDFDQYYKKYLYFQKVWGEWKFFNFENEIENNIEEKLELYRKFKLAIKNCSQIFDKESELKEFQSYRRKYTLQLENAKRLNNVIRETENQFMEMRINQINFQLNEILELLFDDINIQISMFRELKGKEKYKPQVSLKIYLGGIEYPNFSYFSGGEKDRISIALTLTFNIILGSPLIMFDEVFSSLEESKREDCLKIIRKYTKNKILLNVCHETIEGFYDKITNF